MRGRLLTALVASLVAFFPSACGGEEEPAPMPQAPPATTAEEPAGYGYG